jgi:hypothetical protein
MSPIDMVRLGNKTGDLTNCAGARFLHQNPLLSTILKLFSTLSTTVCSEVHKGCSNECNKGMEKRLSLWDAEDRTISRTIKADCLDEIAKQCGVTSVEVKEKLDILCRQFKREHFIVHVCDSKQIVK